MGKTKKIARVREKTAKDGLRQARFNDNCSQQETMKYDNLTGKANEAP